MSWRRFFLAAAATFIAYLLWLIIDKASAVSIGAIWPLLGAFIAILMLPETRLQGEIFVRLIAALRGKDIDTPTPRNEDEDSGD